MNDQMDEKTEGFAPLPTVPGNLNFPIGIDPNRTSEILNYLDEQDFLENKPVLPKD